MRVRERVEKVFKRQTLNENYKNSSNCYVHTRVNFLISANNYLNCFGKNFEETQVFHLLINPLDDASVTTALC